MSYYRKNTHILHLPSQVKCPGLSVLKTNTDNVYTESKTLLSHSTNWMPLSTDSSIKSCILQRLIKREKDNELFNKTLTNNIQDTDDILDIDSWFHDEIQSSMIFTFIFCISAIIAFIFLECLCYKHEKL